MPASLPSVCSCHSFLLQFRGCVFKFLQQLPLPGLCRACSKNTAAGGRAEYLDGLPADTVAQVALLPMAEPVKPVNVALSVSALPMRNKDLTSITYLSPPTQQGFFNGINLPNVGRPIGVQLLAKID